MRLIRLLALAVIMGFTALASLPNGAAQAAPVAAAALAGQTTPLPKLDNGGYQKAYYYYYRRPYYRRHYYYHRPYYRHYYYRPRYYYRPHYYHRYYW